MGPNREERSLNTVRYAMNFEIGTGHESVSGRAKVILHHFMSEMVGVQRLHKTFKLFRLKLHAL